MMQFSFLMCLLLLLCQSSLWWGVVSPCSRPGFRHHFNRRTTNPSTFQHFSASFFISVVVSNSAAPSQLSAPYKHQQPHSGPSPYLNVVEVWWVDAVQVCPPPPFLLNRFNKGCINSLHHHHQTGITRKYSIALVQLQLMFLQHYT